jgi:hypothetical protein
LKSFPGLWGCSTGASDRHVTAWRCSTWGASAEFMVSVWLYASHELMHGRTWLLWLKASNCRLHRDETYRNELAYMSTLKMATSRTRAADCVF